MLVSEARCHSCGAWALTADPVPPNLELPAKFAVDFGCSSCDQRWYIAGTGDENTIEMASGDWRSDDARALPE